MKRAERERAAARRIVADLRTMTGRMAPERAVLAMVRAVTRHADAEGVPWGDVEVAVFRHLSGTSANPKIPNNPRTSDT